MSDHHQESRAEYTAPDHPRDLHRAIAHAELGIALFVWRETSDHDWRITDWEGVPKPIDRISDVGRVDLAGIPKIHVSIPKRID